MDRGANLATKSASLFYRAGPSDKEYHLQLEPAKGGFVVNFQFGRRGGTLQTGTKTDHPIPYGVAVAMFDRIYTEKYEKGYRPSNDGAKPGPVAEAGPAKSAYPVEELAEITQDQAVELLQDERYWLQEKRDGHRRQIEKAGAQIRSYNKKGQVVPVPADLHREIGSLACQTCFLDGELEGDNFIAWDLLELNDCSLGYEQIPYQWRFHRLKELLEQKNRSTPHVTLIRNWATRSAKILGAKALHEERAEGLVFKLASAEYRSLGRDQHKKFKFVKTCSALVFEVARGGKESIGVALYNGQGELVPVGSCSTIGKPVPKVGEIVEVRYLYATADRKLYQGIYLRQRDDVEPKACKIGQLVFKKGVA
jgi:bifunctional non-homologous end joining protein LigD